MRKINLTITGCMGRMGQQLIKSVNKDKAVKISSLTENYLVNKIYSDFQFTNIGSFLIQKI